MNLNNLGLIGEIKTSDKIFFNSIKKTYSHGPIKNMDPMIKNSICGICNLDIATGTQMKILTYMSYGLPCVSSDLSFKNTFFKRNKEILVYKNSDDFLKIPIFKSVLIIISIIVSIYSYYD